MALSVTVWLVGWMSKLAESTKVKEQNYTLWLEYARDVDGLIPKFIQNITLWQLYIFEMRGL